MLEPTLHVGFGPVLSHFNSNCHIMAVTAQIVLPFSIRLIDLSTLVTRTARPSVRPGLDGIVVRIEFRLEHYQRRNTAGHFGDILNLLHL